MTRRLRTLAGLALLAAGCLHFYRLELPDSRTWSAEIDRAHIGTLNGSLEITAAADTALTAWITRRCFGRSRSDAEAHIDNITIADTVADGRLELRITAPSGPRSYGADVEVALPPGAELDLRTSNGPVTIAGPFLGVAARSSNAPVNLTGTSGRAELRTSNGPVTVAVHSGSITAKTSNGPVNCDLVLIEPTGRADIETSGGDVTLSLPRDVSARFDLETSNGDVTVGAGFGPVEYTRSERAHKTGRLGSGAAEIRIKTSNANIVLLPR